MDVSEFDYNQKFYFTLLEKKNLSLVESVLSELFVYRGLVLREFF